jgi:hypothetical protein
MFLAHILSPVSGISFAWRRWSTCSTQYNKGYTAWWNYLSNSQTVELYGGLLADLLILDRMLINGVDMNIKLTRATECFYVLTLSDDTKLSIKILDATLFITEVELKHPLLLAPAVLCMKRKSHYPVTHYPVTHTRINTFTASSWAQRISINNAFREPIPEIKIIAVHPIVCRQV